MEKEIKSLSRKERKIIFVSLTDAELDELQKHNVTFSSIIQFYLRNQGGSMD